MSRSVEHELELAGRIQASFLPETLPQLPGWQLTAEIHPARETSGDFFGEAGLVRILQAWQGEMASGLQYTLLEAVEALEQRPGRQDDVAAMVLRAAAGQSGAHPALRAAGEPGPGVLPQRALVPPGGGALRSRADG